VINRKAFAGPMIVRLAWHASGTYDKADNTGGSNGAGMRYEPESTDDANAGLGIARDMIARLPQKYPGLSYADLWTYAGVCVIEFMGGPKVPFNFGRSDSKDNGKCPANGRLPDAAQGAQHIRDVFYRMGFDDRGIVALSGAHTLGSCHRTRSGFEGPWTHHATKFDNRYFKNILELTWVPREWDGPLQYVDKESGKLMMLPTDLAIRDDPEFLKWTKAYAEDEKLFFDDFAKYFGQLIALGCPPCCQPDAKETALDGQAALNAEFRDECMHGHTDAAKALASKVDCSEVEASSGRSALHKAAFWGHEELVSFLLSDCKIDPNIQDYNGDTALHDAARFGHVNVAKSLLASNADSTIQNADGEDALAVATAMGKTDVIDAINAKRSSL